MLEPPPLGTTARETATPNSSRAGEATESFGLPPRWSVAYSVWRVWFELASMAVGAVVVAIIVLSIPLTAPMSGAHYPTFGESVSANWVYLIIVEPLMVVLGFAFAFENRVALYMRLRLFDAGAGCGRSNADVEADERAAADDLLFIRRSSYRVLPALRGADGAVDLPAVSNGFVRPSPRSPLSRPPQSPSQAPPLPPQSASPFTLSATTPLTGADVHRLSDSPQPPPQLQPQPPSAIQLTPTLGAAAASTVVAAAAPTTPSAGGADELKFGPLWQFRALFWCSSLLIVMAIAVVHIGVSGGFDRFSSLVEYGTIALISVVFHRIYFWRHPAIMRTPALVATAQTGLLSLFLLPSITLLLFAYQNASSSTVQDLLIIALGALEFALRLGLGTLFRGRSLLSRKVVWPSLWAMAGSQLFALAALSSSQSVSSYAVAFVVTFTTVLLHASVLTRTGHAVKSALEIRFGMATQSYIEHVRRVSASFFFTVLANAIAGFQYALLSVVLRAGPNSAYFPTISALTDAEYYTSIGYAMVQFGTAVIEIVVMACAVWRVFEVDVYRLAYYCMRDMGWVVVFSMMINGPLLVGWVIQAHSRLIQ